MAKINDLFKNFLNTGKELVKGVVNETENTIKTTFTDVFLTKEEDKTKSYTIASTKKSNEDDYDLQAKLQEIIDNYKNSN